MKEKFNLSEKIEYSNKYMSGVIPTVSVKEYIKRLKEEISLMKQYITQEDTQLIINRLSGDKLI